LPLTINPLETARFGIKAARVSDDTAPPEVLARAARAQGVQMLTVRVPASNLPRVHALTAAGYQIMDCLVYWSKALHDLAPLADSADIRAATPEDADAVGQIAAQAFAGYIGHYHTDPRLDRTAADAAYVEWAQTSITGVSVEAPAFVSLAENKVAGFLTLRKTDPVNADIMLNAVAPTAQGQGHYGRLLHTAQHHAVQMGATQIEVSTQITNTGVQRAWARQGFTLTRSFFTFHKWFDGGAT